MRAMRLPPSAVRGQHGLIESWCAWPYPLKAPWFRQRELVQFRDRHIACTRYRTEHPINSWGVENCREAIRCKGIGLHGIKHDDVVLADESTIAIHPVLRYRCCYQPSLLIA